MKALEHIKFIKANKSSMSHKEMAAALGISKTMIGYYLYRYQNEKVSKADKKRKEKTIHTPMLKRITKEQDYSTNGIFDVKKWAKCSHI